MIQLHFGVKQLKVGKTMGVLHSFVWNYVKYANMEGFHRNNQVGGQVSYTNIQIQIHPQSYTTFCTMGL